MIPIWFIILVMLEFACLGYATKWFTIRLYKGKAQRQKEIPLARLWWKTFEFYHPYRNPKFFPPKELPTYIPEITGFRIVNARPKGWHERGLTGLYTVYLNPGIREVLCGADWLDKHWADLKDYTPKVELDYGNGYHQTFTLKKPKLIKEIIKINTGKKYFKQLMAQGV